jgi:APA family basic amino acid/polyamine antiporter
MADAGLRRVLGLPALLFYGVGLILGAGVYSIIGAAAGVAGGGLWLAFLLASVVALATGLSYAELAAMHPKAGADYVYAKAAFPGVPLLAPLTGFLLAASGTGTAATVATAFGGYLREFAGVPVLASAAALLVAATALNLAGVKHGSRANIAMTLVEVAGLTLVIAAGLSRPGLGAALDVPGATALLGASGLVFFAFLGFENVANLAGEARRPERDLPRAILLSVAVATGLYLLVAVAVLALASPEELAGSEAPLAAAAAKADPRLGSVLAGIALFATANTALVALLAASRMLFGVARGGDAPRPLGRVLRSRGTPWVAALTVLGLSLLLLPTGGTALLGSVSSAVALGAFVVVNACLVRLRFTKPSERRPFRVPLAVGRLPLPPLVGVAGAVGFAAFLEVEALLLGAGLVALGLVSLLVARRVRRGERREGGEGQPRTP